MSEEFIQNMERLVDDPSNGMMLQRDIHDIFDKLKVYLEPTEVSPQSCILVIPHVDQRPSEKTSTQSRMLGAGRGYTLSTSSVKPSPSEIMIALHGTYHYPTLILLHYTQASPEFYI
jgi:hypothetical protein